MPQTIFSYKAKVLASDYENVSMRYTRGRIIINKIRKVLGRAIQDMGSIEYAYAVGKHVNGSLTTDELQSIQNAAEISKWTIVWDQQQKDPETLSGELSLVLENSTLNQRTLNMLILQAAEVSGFELKLNGIENVELDYAFEDTNFTYHISNLYPGIARHWTDKKRREELPVSMMPADRASHAKTIGQLIKRHIIETAEFNGLDTSELQSSPLFVQSSWVACPKEGKDTCNEDNWHASIQATFSVPFKLEGAWFAGGHRHINSGIISQASENQIHKLKTGGTFVL